MAALGTSAANVALPTLAREFGASLQAVQWVVLAYLLAITAAIVIAGRFGDLMGRRRLLRGALLLFAASAAASGLAPSLELLFVARAAQGLGAAAMMALAMALVSELIPDERTGSAMGLLGTSSAIGTALGPSLGGVLIAGLSWRAIFFVQVPFAFLALALTQRAAVTERPMREPKRERFDHAGTALLVLTLTAYALSMTVGRGRFSVVNLALLLLAALGATLFVAVERNAPTPLIQLALLRAPERNASLASNALVSTVVMATLVVGPFYLSRALGLGPGPIGLVMSVGPVVSALIGAPAGRLVDRFGTFGASLVGLTGSAVGCLVLALSPRGFGVPGYVFPLIVLTAGYALFQAANNTAVMRSVPAEQRGVVAGTLSLSRNLGLVTGASVMGAVLSLGAGTGDVTLADAGAVSQGTRAAFLVGAGLIALAITLVVSAMRGSAGGSPAGRPAPSP